VCNGTGYKGRRGIFEFLRGGPDLESIILKDFSYLTLQTFAHTQGMVTMQEDGILKILAGITDEAEVEGATGPLLW
jgi:type II secretory ATPase GspE/PulE/Tfp pilus assembly ATPase PilB-like protein